MKVSISRYGTKAILLTWEAKIDERTLNEMTYLIQVVQKKYSGICNINHAYHEVLIQFNKNIQDFAELNKSLQSTLLDIKMIKASQAHLWTIPVCYDLSLASDLSHYLKLKELTLEQLIRLHTAPIYTVYFTGFLPGFLYLGGLDDTLTIDRKSKPSRFIKKGTVAIGGTQTGVYPQDSPGGWYGIGYTPISFFEPQNKIPTWAKTGDKIRFESVEKDAIKNIQRDFGKGGYTIKSIPYES